MTVKKKLQEKPQTRLPLSKKLDGIVCPDGIEILVNWKELEVGMSVFVPAINTKELKKQLKDAAFFQNMTIESRDMIENKKLGVRFWRIL